MPNDKRHTKAPPVRDIANVVAAFSEEHVERITGLTRGRLRYWARTGFFVPSYAEGNGRPQFSRFYSFKDIVALRTLEMLRVQNGVPLQHLRKCAETLSHLKDELWTKTVLYVVARKVVFENPETGAPEEVVSGQYLLGVPLLSVMRDTAADVFNLSARRQSQRGHVGRSRAISHNSWVVSGTRIPVAAIRRLHEDGFSSGQIRDEYPDLTDEDIQAALRHKASQAA